MIRKNLKGKRFGKLIVLSIYTTDRGGRIRWKCMCDCGKERDVLSSHLIQGNTKSCGCGILKGKEHKQWTGHEGITGQFWGGVKRSANGDKGRRKIPLIITIQQAWQLFLKQGGRCALTGIKLTLPQRYNERGTASLDRIDSYGSYELENVQWVHKDINIMKNCFTQEYFKEMCKRVSGYCDKV